MGKIGNILNKGGRTEKIAALVITSFLIFLLIVSGPAQALSLKIDGLSQGPYSSGDSVNFLGSIEILSNERVNLQNVSLKVNDEIVCTFTVLGENLTACDGININLVEDGTEFGYGYGQDSFIKNWTGSDRDVNAGNYYGYSYGYNNGFSYGYGYTGNGRLVYNITIQTPQSFLIVPGTNDLNLIAISDKQEFNSRTEKFEMKKPRPQRDDVNVTIEGLNEVYNDSQDISFTGKVLVSDGVETNFSNINLNINGNNVCTFAIDENLDILCPGMEVSLTDIEYDQFGDLAKAKYDFIIHSQESFLNIPGNNELVLSVNSEFDTFPSNNENFVILKSRPQRDDVNVAIDGLIGVYNDEQNISFSGKVVIADYVASDFKNMSLNINGNNVCTFAIDENLDILCPGMEVELTDIETDQFGNLAMLNYEFNVSGIESFLNRPGNNELVLSVSSDLDTFLSETKSFEILPPEFVTLCHVPPGNPRNAKTMIVKPNQVQGHLNHGDYLGVCLGSTASPIGGIIPEPVHGNGHGH